MLSAVKKLSQSTSASSSVIAKPTTVGPGIPIRMRITTTNVRRLSDKKRFPLPSYNHYSTTSSPLSLFQSRHLLSQQQQQQLRRNYQHIHHHHQQQRRLLSSKNAGNGKNNNNNSNNGSSLPPLPKRPESKKPLSPAQAKREYLQSIPQQQGMSKAATGGKVAAVEENPMERLKQLQNEINEVKLQQTQHLDKKLNKGVLAKLTDPIKRYRHSFFNILAMTISYVLAHNLYVNKKHTKSIQQKLNESQQHVVELQQLLLSLLKDDEEENGSKDESRRNTFIHTVVTKYQDELYNRSNGIGDEGRSSGGWSLLFGGGRSSNSSRRASSSSNEDEEEYDLLVSIIKKELESRIGDSILPDDERKQKKMKELLEENKMRTHMQKKKNAADEDDDEKALLQLALTTVNETEETTTTTTDQDGKKVVQKRVFSM